MVMMFARFDSLQHSSGNRRTKIINRKGNDMSNERMIRKKFNKTVCDCMVLDRATGLSEPMTVIIDGRHRFNEVKLKRAIRKKLPSGTDCVKVTGITVISETRCMTEEFFLKNSMISEGV